MAFVKLAVLCLVIAVCEVSGAVHNKDWQENGKSITPQKAVPSMEIRVERLELQRKQDQERFEKLELKLKQYEELIDLQDYRIKQYEEDMTHHNPIMDMDPVAQKQLPREGLKTMFDSPVAFTAGLSTSFSGGGDYAVIPYNHIYLNHGEGYSTADYHFTAPVRGIYWFTASFFTQSTVRVILAVNGEYMVQAEDQMRYGGAALSAILMLQTGDRISCRKHLSGQDMREEFPPPSFNTFAGFLYAQL